MMRAPIACCWAVTIALSWSTPAWSGRIRPILVCTSWLTKPTARVCWTTSRRSDLHAASGSRVRCLALGSSAHALSPKPLPPLVTSSLRSRSPATKSSSVPQPVLPLRARSRAAATLVAMSYMARGAACNTRTRLIKANGDGMRTARLRTDCSASLWLHSRLAGEGEAVAMRGTHAAERGRRTSPALEAVWCAGEVAPLAPREAALELLPVVP